MPSRSEHKARIEINGERFGPVRCELEEHAGSPAPQQKHGWSGTLTFDLNSNLPPMLPTAGEEFTLILNDGRQGTIIIRHLSTVVGRRNKQRIEFYGQGALRKIASDAAVNVSEA